jgi:hypothetical protein
MGFGARDFAAARNENKQQPQQQQRRQSPVDVILGIREELAEFKKAGGKQALRAKWRKACEEALLRTMHGPDPFEPALSEPGGVIEYLEHRGLIRTGRRSRNRKRRNGENG